MSLADPRQSALDAGLRYVSDDRPGFSRRRRGKGFEYLDADGRPVTEDAVRRRLRSLVIPPAWTAVWICPDARGHLQATGRDARGRKQYVYHPRWQEVRSETKFGRLAEFAAALPRIRRAVARDLRRRRLSRERVLALVVHLLDVLHVRVGNPEYARANESYGLTTLREDHLEVRGDRVRIAFRGKSGKQVEVDLRDRRVARLLEQLQDLPGQELFRYLDPRGEAQPIDSQDVNDYLRGAAGGAFTAKDLRTWSGTVLAARALHAMGPPGSATERRRLLSAAVKQVAASLHNTPTVCRKYYIHPAVFAAFEAATLGRYLRDGRPAAGHRLSGEERGVARLILTAANGDGRARSGRAQGARPRGAR